MGYLAAVITCSDRAAADIYEDRSGPVLRDGLAALGFEVEPARIVPDDAAVIATAITEAVAAGARVVLTTGGTGVSPQPSGRPGLPSRRPRGGRRHDAPCLSCRSDPTNSPASRRPSARRAPPRRRWPVCPGGSPDLAVIREPGRSAFVFNAPGSRGGARDALAVLEPLLVHIVEQLDGADHDLNRPASPTR
jgi:molybdopterin biosynthesis enzyme MoaB